MNQENQYLKNITDKCVSCGKKIPVTWESYNIRGNYCSVCNQKAAKNSKIFAKRSAKTIKNNISIIENALQTLENPKNRRGMETN